MLAQGFILVIIKNYIGGKNMKKFLAVITAICVMLTASITAFAQSHPKSKDVQNEIDKSLITSPHKKKVTIQLMTLLIFTT